MLSVKRGRPTSKAKNYVECVDNKRVKCAFCLRLLSNATNRIKSHLIKTCKLCPMDIKQILSDEFGEKDSKVYF